MSRNPYIEAKRGRAGLKVAPAGSSQPQATAVNAQIGALLALGLADHEAGRLGEAERRYRQILATDPGHAEALHLLGMVAYQTGNLEAGAELLARAIARDSGDARYYSNLGNILQAMHKHGDSLACYERALVLNPLSVAALSNLGLALQTLGRLEEAEARLERALELRPQNPDVETNLGNLLQAQGRFAEAAAHHERALALRPGYAEAHSNLGAARDALGLAAEALACYERALVLKPDLDAARLGRALLRLRFGDYESGLPDYEARRFLAKARTPALPQWRGGPIAGSILLYAEQGLGDSLHFLRYLPWVRERIPSGCRLVLEIQPSLKRLAAASACVDFMVSAGEEWPAPVRDLATGQALWECPLMSLPLAFGTTVETIPAEVPYLRVAEEARRAVVELPWDLGETAGRLRVGLVWAGSGDHLNDRFRSISLAELEPLLVVAKAQFYSLQMGAGAGQLSVERCPVAARITDLTPSIHDMADTAALIERLDLVITVDTSVAHLAGALGKPVWVMVPFVPDWRWMVGREDSPWYPSMRLFRQPRIGDWGAVIGAVRAALVDLVAGGIVGADAERFS